MKIRFVSLVLLSAVQACAKQHDAPVDVLAPELRPSPVRAAPAAPEPDAGDAPDAIIAIGDLHGDLRATRRALQLAGAIDEKDHWIGGKLVVVQTGDVLDRGDDDKAVLDLLEGLRKSAREAGGQLLTMSGNHEVMNVAHDYRYVTQGSFAAFGGEQGRAQAFQPGGPYARLLSDWPVVAKLGDSVFVHGGVLEKFARLGIARINADVRAYMLGELSQPPAVITDEDGPLWTRRYSASPTPEDCAELERALQVLGAARMVVGHTPQSQGINAACDGKVWRIDVGMSHFYGGPTQVLELRGSQAMVRRLDD